MMNDRLTQYIASEIYPKLRMDEISNLLSHLSPIQKNDQLVTMHCPECTNPQSDYYLGTGLIVCKSCGSFDIYETLNKHLSITADEFILDISKQLNITLPIDISTEIDKNKPKLIATIKNIARLKDDQELLRRGLTYDDITSDYILIGNVDLLINAVIEKCGYIPNKIISLLKSCVINVPLIALNNNGKLYITDIKESEIGIYKRAKSKEIYMTDDPILFSILARNGKKTFLLGKTTTNKYIYDKIVNDKNIVSIIGIWKQKKNYNRIVKTIKFNIVNHYYEWFENEIDNCYSALKKEFI